jgi:hypothetical protein
LTDIWVRRRGSGKYSSAEAVALLSVAVITLLIAEIPLLAQVGFIEKRKLKSLLQI